MRENYHEPLKKPFLYSSLVHLFVVSICFLDFSSDRRSDILCMNIEMVNEHELNDFPKKNMSKKILEGLDEFIEKEVKEEPKVIEEPKKENEILEPSKIEPEPQKIEDTKNAEELPKEEVIVDEKNVENDEKKIEEERLRKEILEKRKARQKKMQEILKSAEKREKAKKIDEDFAKIFNSVDKEAQDISEDNEHNTSKSGNRDGSFLDSEMISQQIYKYWAVPAGIKDAEKMIIEIEITLNDDGSVIPSQVTILDMARYNSDMVFKAAADSAKRAILQASPLKLPKNSKFKKFVFKFNLKKALGV